MWSRVVWAGAIISPAAGTASGAFIMGMALLEGRVSPEVVLFGTAASFYAYVVAGAYGGVVMLASAVVMSGSVSSRGGWAGLER
jgi:hypothetical protein